MVVPFSLYRFAAEFDRPRRSIRYAAVIVTAAALVATAALAYFPLPRVPPPPGFGAYRLLVVVQWTFLFTFVVRMWQAGGG